MARRLLTLLLVGLLIVAGAVVVYAGDDEAERPGPKGSAGVACDEIAQPDDAAGAFVASLDPGETGCFREGTHSADDVITLSAPTATLTSYPGERATLAGRLVVRRGADGATIENLTLDGSSGDGPSPTVNANDVSFRGNDVTNGHRGICFVLGDDRYGQADGTLIEDNRIHDCGRLPATNQDHGIYVAHASGTVIRDNLIYGNADRGIQLYPDADDSLVTGNVIDGNGQGVIISGNESSASENNLIELNLITNSTIRYNVESHWPGPVGSANVVRRNCVFGGARDDGQGGIKAPAEGFEASDNVVADPLYVDPGTGDFALEDGSPCAELGA
jgi:parallel beta-helix repeat protein